MVERTFSRNFENLNQKWRPCALCGQQMYPESQLTFIDGIYLCSNHYHFRYDRKNLDEYLPEVEDSQED